MTRADALRAARALLDGMAGTTEGEWDEEPDDSTFTFCLLRPSENRLDTVASDVTANDAAHIARSCPARLGPILRALMEGED